VTDTVPVVLVPGRASGVPMWSENLPGFLKDRRVIAFDALEDAGLSVQGAPMDSFDDQALWMKQVLAELAPSGAHLVGHSFGGATAATYAHRFPDLVVSLTLLEPVFTFAYSCAPHGMGDALVLAGHTRPGAQCRAGQGGRSRVRPERQHG
jgi:pimeloyl-ACP methyl ester carboxylesterase